MTCKKYDKKLKTEVKKALIPVDETVGKLRTMTEKEDEIIAKIHGRKPYFKK